ncbi:tubulin monoglutamylase TTLL4 [Pelodytes ibericus]
MASADTELYLKGLACENQGVLMPGHRERSKEVKSRSHTFQATPVWKLERRSIEVGYRVKYNHYKVPPAYCLCSECNSTSSAVTASHSLIAPTRSFHSPKSPQDASDGSFDVQHPENCHKLYLKRESLRLMSKCVKQRPYSSSLNKNPRSTPCPRLTKTDSAMTSSLINQFHLPNVAGETPDFISSRPSSAASKQPVDSTRPSLITNSFLRPTSAKVPLHPHSGSKKTKSACSGGANCSSWNHGGKGDLGHLNDNVQPLYCHCTTKPKVPHPPASSSVHPTAWQVLDRSNMADHSPCRVVHLTEAVKKLVQRSAPLLETTFNSVCHSDMVHALCKQKEPNEFHPANQTESKAGILASDGHYFNGSTGNADACSKHAIHADDLNLHIYHQAARTPSLNRESQLPAMTETAQGVNITVMATQISTIHLDKAQHVRDALLPSEKMFLNKLELPLPNSEPECAEEELPDGLDDSQEEEEDEGNEYEGTDSSFTQVSSDTSISAISGHCPEPALVNGETVLKPALTASLFPNMPQTIYFGTQDEKVEMLPWSQRKLMKWRMSTVTPNVVKHAIARSHFRVTKKNHDWLGCWGHHMKSTAFKTIREYQKLNHFPGSFQIGRKDRLWRNLSKMQARFGRKEFNFFPQSFVLPQDIKLLKKAWEEGGTRQKWIIKPPASARGMGIQVIHKWSQLPKRRPLLVQRYLHKPYLISGSKFDLRIYVYVTSYDPLRVYMFTDGLVRFASCKYSSSMKSLSNKFMHLTNYSVNKKNAEYKDNSDQTACQGHKWALKALWSYLNQQGLNSDRIWEKIKDMVIKTVIASEPYVNSLVKTYVQRPYSCHELFGFDIMLDENLKPWVLEVNISPSLHSNSQLDVNIKGQMVSDLLNLAGFVLPNKEDIATGEISSSSFTSSASSLGKDRGRSAEIAGVEKMKRARYLTSKMPDKDLYATILDHLTPEDVRVLAETEDELSRCGQFERVFPSPISSRYLRFFEQPRYFNILTNQWEQKYYTNRERGRDFLKSLCLMNFHSGSSAHATVRSLPRSPGHPEFHLNGFTKAEVIKQSKVLLTSEEGLKPHHASHFHQNPGTLQQAERHLSSHALSHVRESTLVM